MNASARTFLTMTMAGALAGCQWIAGIEDTTVGDAGHTDGDASGSGDAGGRPDARAPAVCPAPCLADAVAEFASEQGGTTGRWVYAQDRAGPFGTDYTELTPAIREGADAWVGTGTIPPAILHCPSSPGYPACTGVEDKLLLETSAEGFSPALVWIVPDGGAGRYRLSGSWQVSPTATEGTPMTLLLVRTSRFDSVLEERFTTSAVPASFDLETDVLPGDSLRLIAITGDSARVPLAVSFYISAAQRPVQCALASQFLDPSGLENQFPDLCGSSPFRDNADTPESCDDPDPLCPPTAPVVAPTGIHGGARAFDGGASIRHLGAPARYQGDFTVQFWARFSFGGGLETVLSDFNCSTESGVRLIRQHAVGTESSDFRFDVLYDNPMFDQCVNASAVIQSRASEDQWHFFRLTRSTATETVSLCIDGEHAGTRTVPADADTTNAEPMMIGRDPTGPAEFRGAIADLRVLGDALPCSAP